MYFLLFQPLTEITPTTITAPPADTNGFILWTVVILVGTVSSLFVLFQKSNKQLVKSYENQITDLKASYANERTSRLELAAQIAPALKSIAETNKEIINLLRHER